ncbi:MAG: NAD(P)-dependent alcohol dehydrogenase [Acidimicrobiia bacterium]
MGRQHTTSDAAGATSAPRMKAVVQRAYGSADTLELVEVDSPEIGPTEVLVEVWAAGVDRGVWHIMTGLPYLVRIMGYGLRRPKTAVLGFDLSGRVVAVGAEVERFEVGDEVFGIGRGSFAEYAVADESKLVAKPTGITHAEAAVAAISGTTAVQAVTDVGRLEPGQTVLVIGASGGVGSYAVQLAKALGGTVTGVARGAKAGFVQDLGADYVIDYTKTDYLDGASRYDLIVDAGGGNPVRKLRRALTRHGTLVIVGAEGGGRWTGGVGRSLRAFILSPMVPQRLTSFIAKEGHEHIARVAEYLRTGEMVAAVGERFELADAAEALRRLEAGTTSGKSVIIVKADHES